MTKNHSMFPKLQGGQIGCLCGCKRIARYRGLHQSCYDALSREVAAGKTTWAQLESEGKANPARSQRAGKSGGAGE